MTLNKMFALTSENAVPRITHAAQVAYSDGGLSHENLPIQAIAHFDYFIGRELQIRKKNSYHLKEQSFGALESNLQLNYMLWS